MYDLDYLNRWLEETEKDLKKLKEDLEHFITLMEKTDDDDAYGLIIMEITDEIVDAEEAVMWLQQEINKF